jgi:hypothetical protein
MFAAGTGTDVVQANDNHTPVRNFRAPNELWEPAKAKAAERGETLTDVLNRALKRYIRPAAPREKG